MITSRNEERKEIPLAIIGTISQDKYTEIITMNLLPITFQINQLLLKKKIENKQSPSSNEQNVSIQNAVIYGKEASQVWMMDGEAAPAVSWFCSTEILEKHTQICEQKNKYHNN